jgi:hypothetical protein
MHWLDPDYLPEETGTFERFLISPHGDPDGLLLGDGREVHFPPHMAADLLAAIPRGAKPRIKIRGVRPHGIDMIAAVAIEMADGNRVVDHGPPTKHRDEEKVGKHGSKRKREPMKAEGVIQRLLHGPKGEVRGALFESGDIVRLPPHEAERISQLLGPRQRLAVRGEGVASELGTVIEAKEAGPSAAELQPLKPKKPKHDNQDEPGDRASEFSAA